MKKKNVILLIVIVLLIGVIAGTAWYFINKKIQNDLHFADQYLNVDDSKFNEAQKNLINDVKNALSSNPKDAEAYKNLGLLYYSMDNYDAAEKLFNHSLTLKPKDETVVMQNLAAVYHNQKRYTEEEALLYKILDINILWLGSYDSLAQLYRFKFVPANPKFPELLQLARDSDYKDQYEQPLLKTLAFYYDYQGDTAKALEYFSEYVKDYPDDQAIIQVYKELGGK